MTDLHCGRCTEERKPGTGQRRRDPGVLGAVVVLAGRPTIHLYHEPSGRQMRNMTTEKLKALFPHPSDQNPLAVEMGMELPVDTTNWPKLPLKRGPELPDHLVGWSARDSWIDLVLHGREIVGWSARDTWVDLADGPDEFDGYCRHHGRVRLRRIDVVAAIANSPNAASMPIQIQ